MDLSLAPPGQRTLQVSQTVVRSFLTQTKVLTLTFQPPKLARSPVRTQVEQERIRPSAAGHDPGQAAMAVPATS